MPLNVALIDANYKHVRHKSLAITWLEWEANGLGMQITAPSDADAILATISSQQGWIKLRTKLRREANGKPIIIGGGGAYAPAVFDGMATACCVGEGHRFMRVLATDGLDAAKALPESWVPSEAKRVIPSGEFPWGVPPLRHPDGTVRVFGSRGCRYKCLFCQTGWESTYRVNPDPGRLARQIAGVTRRSEKLAIITNDGADVDVLWRGQQEFLSVRFSNLKRMMPIARSRAKGVRIGVEGVSERLRTAVGKPVANDELVEITAQLIQNHVGVRWFFVLGLPGEIEADYEELRWLISELKRFPGGCVMMNFHAFIPQPAAPLCVFPLEDTYWEPFDEFRRWIFDGPGFTRRAMIVAPCKYPGRLARAKLSMAATETELRRGWFDHDNANWRIRYRATPDQMRQMARVYAGKLGTC